MQIQLAESFMFFLPGGKFHMSDENPGPLEVDFELLTEEEKRIIINGITSRKIKSDVDVKSLQARPQEKVIAKQDEDGEVFYQHARPPTIQQVQGTYEDSLRPTLNKGVGSIKKELGQIDDIRKLRVMLELESKQKNRTSVKDLLQARLNHLAGSIQDNIQKNIATASPVIHDPIERLSLDMEVEEVIVDERTVELE